MEELKIDPEFRDKIPPLTEAEFAQLKENILADGEVYEPIVVWNGTIVDGHNRWKIILEHPGIPYRLKHMHFADRWAALDWMCKKQLGRRNLTDEQRTVLIGKMYEARKKSRTGNHPKERNADGTFHGGQNGAHGGERKKTRELIAEELGVGVKTVERAERFAHGVEAIKAISPDAAEKILSGGSKVTKATVIQFPNMDKKQQKAVAEQIANGGAVSNVSAKKADHGTTSYVGTRKDFARIAEISDIVSSNRGNAYTLDDALAEMKVIEQEFLDKARRVLQIRRDVINGDKKMLRLIYQFADDIEQLREELTNENA